MQEEHSDTPMKEVEHTRHPAKEVENTRDPCKGEKTPSTAIYNHYNQSYWLTQVSNQMPNKAIFPIFQYTKHEI